MKKVIIDGKNLKDKKSLHLILKEKLNLPEYYGENLDALWDCLTGDIAMPLSIVWENFNESKNYLGEYADKAAEVLLKAEKHFHGKLKIEINL